VWLRPPSAPPFRAHPPHISPETPPLPHFPEPPGQGPTQAVPMQGGFCCCHPLPGHRQRLQRTRGRQKYRGGHTLRLLYPPWAKGRELSSCQGWAKPAPWGCCRPSERGDHGDPTSATHVVEVWGRLNAAGSRGRRVLVSRSRFPHAASQAGSEHPGERGRGRRLQNATRETPSLRAPGLQSWHKTSSSCEKTLPGAG